jgi:hypothetical protein
MLLLAVLAVLTGVVTTRIIRRMTDTAALRATFKRMQAHLLEFGLFFDEPALIWRAQIALLRDNLQLVRLLLTPALLLTIPMTWLFLQLDAAYGHRPLSPGEPAVVTAQLNRPIDPGDRFDLSPAAGIAVETPAVRVAGENQVAWRIRPEADGASALTLSVNGHSVRKTVAAGGSRTLLSPRRTHSLTQFLLHPEEPRIPAGDIAWIEIAYPETSPTWIVWFFAISGIAAITSAVPRPTRTSPRARPN